MKTKITLIADEGMILTDGTHYGRVVYLPAEMDGSNYYEISEELYKIITKESEEKIIE